MTTARARHILVTTKKECLELLERINKGEAFDIIAEQHSKCPSGKKGGDLGEFKPGMMVKEFDKVVFSGNVGEVYGPVQTQFGYHLIEILSRS
ncbi:MAG TPA: peptidylprolyl isomerase [Candidatus Riflebacteria bacterium]|jgi:peptidyl-prolyl cis-trans isomerase C|nr:MAG: peptidylprolyl isomerase [Candidatus Riflebacteria bacterium HGW-Riflebacteria-1]HAE37340.1 peptidylprolyl isomerase [Candidatus Riflebacteria bacterium]